MMSDAEIETIYRTHARWLQRWLIRKLGDAQTAADVTQDVFLRLLSRAHAAPVQAPRALLLTIAQRVLVSRWRHEQLMHQHHDALSAALAQAALSAERHAQGREAWQGVQRRLRGLSNRTREIFVLRRRDGLPLAAIAARLQLSVATVKRELAVAAAVCLREGVRAAPTMSHFSDSCDF